MCKSFNMLHLLSAISLLSGIATIFFNNSEQSWLLLLLAGFFGALGAKHVQKVFLNFKKGEFNVVAAKPDKIEKSIEISKFQPKLSDTEIVKITKTSEDIPETQRTDADYLVLSIAAHRANNSENALRFAYIGLSKPSSNMRVKSNLLHRVAFELNGFGQKEEALLKYDEAIAADPTFAWPHNNRGILLKEMNRNKDALTAFNEAILLDPGDSEIQSNRGDLLEKMRLFDEALAAYDIAIQLDPENVNAYANRGRLFYKLDQHEKALADNDKGLELDPKKVRLHNNRGYCLLKLNRDKEALASINNAIQIDPAYANGYDSLGDCLQEIGREEEALAAYDKAILLDPEFISAHKSRGALLESMGRVN